MKNKLINKRIATGVLALALSAGSVAPINVFADDITSDNFATGTTVSSEFTATDEELLGYKTTVTIPANLNLTYDSNGSHYFVNTQLKTKGAIPADKDLVVTISKATYYPEGNKSNGITADSYSLVVIPNGNMMDTKIDAGDSWMCSWTPDEVYNGTKNIDTKAKQLNISLPKSNVRYASKYTANFTFSIGVNKGVTLDTANVTTDNSYTKSIKVMSMDGDLFPVANRKVYIKIKENNRSNENGGYNLTAGSDIKDSTDSLETTIFATGLGMDYHSGVVTLDENGGYTGYYKVVGSKDGGESTDMINKIVITTDTSTNTISATITKVQ